MSTRQDLHLTLGADGIERAATFSACGAYRYELRRDWGREDESDGRVLWIMLNPSTADHKTDDRTIGRCIAFTRAWEKGGLTVVNLFAYRATKPAVLRELAARDAAAAVGPDNDAQIEAMVRAHSRRADLIVVGWGGNGADRALRSRRREVLRMLPVEETHCVGETKSGDPQHPLYVPGDRGPVRFEGRIWREAWDDAPTSSAAPVKGMPR